MLLPRAFTVFFVLSGFCSLVDQVVWLRLTMAAFGVTTPMVSMLLAVFMAGLALGSAAGGRVAAALARRSLRATVVAYGAVEVLVAASVLVVPPGLNAGRAALAGGAWASGSYYAGAGAWTALLLLPFCTAMGATLPLGIAALRSAGPAEAERSFSRLYLANVVGAALGTAAAALVLIELLGLTGTLRAAALVNLAIGAAAFALAVRAPATGAAPDRAAGPPPAAPGLPLPRASAILFTTGCASLAMEVVWIRQLTPYLGNLVYSFAIILVVYLIATFGGSLLYRRRGRWLPNAALRSPWPWLVLALLAVLPAVAADPRLPLAKGMLPGALRALLGIAPFCAALGFLTPLVVDRATAGDPRRAGAAYAANVVGGILGPLLAGFVLLPRLDERWTLWGLGAAPLLFVLWTGAAPERRPVWRRLVAAGLGAGMAAALVVSSRTFESLTSAARVRRDHTATVTAAGRGRSMRLLVNGIGMTALTPITKLMAHLPLALLERPPASGLAVCFGMGTTFRSIHSWGIEATAVELVPSVPEFFDLYHADGARILRSPGARVAIDDGRRFLDAESGRYDVIVVDPPPPISAAGSSLLYSVEFHAAARRRLAPGGIVQQWIPRGDPFAVAAIARAFRAVFPHVRVFHSIEGWGVHLLGSDRPIELAAPELLAARLPPAAAADLVEWGPADSPAEMFRRQLAQEISLEQLFRRAPGAAALTDDHPINEYFLLRRAGRRAAAARP